MVLDCEGCGKQFHSSNCPGPMCIKCKKLLEAKGKIYSSAEVKAEASSEIKVSIHVL